MAKVDVNRFNELVGAFHARAGQSFNTPGTPLGVGIDAAGKIVAGAGVSGIVGVLLPAKGIAADQQVNVVVDGDLLDTGFNPGDVLYAAAVGGAISTTNTGTRVGFALDAGRMRVQVEH